MRLRAACDACHSSKVKCTGEREACARCRNSGLECIYSVSMAGKVQGKRKRSHQTGDRLDSSIETEPVAACRMIQNRENLHESQRLRLESSETSNAPQTEPGDHYNFELPIYSPPLDAFSPIHHDSAIDVCSSPFTNENFPFPWGTLDSISDTLNQKNEQAGRISNNHCQSEDGTLVSEAVFGGKASKANSWKEDYTPSSWMCVFAGLRKSQRQGIALDVIISETRLALRHIARALDDADKQSLVCERAEICLMVLCLQSVTASLSSARQRVYSRQRRESVRIGVLELNAMDQREIFGAILQKEAESAVALSQRVLDDMSSVGDRRFMSTGQMEISVVVEQLKGIIS